MAGRLRLSEEECWERLARAHTGILTTLRRDGMPVSLPVWFVALDRRVYVSGPAATKKFTRVRHDPRVAFLVESGERWSELVGVHLTGVARVVDDPAVLDSIAAAMDAKYARFRTSHDEMPERTRRHYETATSTIEIVPDDRILSWDNSRLVPGGAS